MSEDKGKLVSVAIATEATVVMGPHPKDATKEVIVSAKPKTRATVEIAFDVETSFDSLPAEVQRRYGLKEFKTTVQDFVRKCMSCDPLGEALGLDETQRRLAEKDWATAERGGARMTGARATARSIMDKVKAGAIDPEKEAALNDALKKAMADLGIEV